MTTDDRVTLVPDQREELRFMLSEKQILDRLPIARSTLQKWEKAGEFPRRRSRRVAEAARERALADHF